MQTAYSEVEAKKYDAERFDDMRGKKIHEVEVSVLMFALQKITLPRNILEVGCGTGRILEELIPLGYSPDGIDPSPFMLEECQKKLSKGPGSSKLYEGEAVRLPFPDNHYDFIYAIRVLNQTESPAYALDAIRDMIRVTQRGGHLLLEYVNESKPRFGQEINGTALTKKQILSISKESGAKQVFYHGEFFFGMTSFHRIPGFILSTHASFDHLMSRLFPSLCSRCYILLKKE